MRVEIAIKASDTKKTIRGVCLVDYLLTNLKLNYLKNNNTYILNNISHGDYEDIKNQFLLNNITFKGRIGEFTSILKYKQVAIGNVNHFINS